MRSRSRIVAGDTVMFGSMSSQAKALTRRDVMDLIRAGLILAITVVAAMIVPPKVFAAVHTATAVEEVK